MNNKILHKAETYRKTHRKKQWLYRGLSVLAAGAVFCTTYALILPAITMEKEPTCGFTEHEHSAACFSENQVIGTYSCLSDLHVHEDGCFDSDGNIICGYADFVVHSHGEFCFNENGDLICELPEILVHTHNEDCFAAPEEAETHEHTENCFTLQKGELLCDTEEYAGHTHEDICVGINSKTLICTVEESEGHVHTEACEGIVSETLSCELEESEGHSHSGECYQTVQTENLICGSEEYDGHVHDETCIGENGELICETEETEGHSHSGECYELTQELVCELNESEGHAHGDNCYTVDTGNICGLEESEGHIHNDDCYEIQTGYICGHEEAEGHIHNDECYEWTEELICDIESNEKPAEEDTELEAVCGYDEIILHEHDEIECFDEDGNLICGRMQVLEHIHTEECLVVEEQELICGLEEHIHDELLCYIDEEADIETAEDWEATLPEELSGNWAEDLIAVAESQLGYTESETNVLVGANGEISHYSRYGAWYGRPYAEWNAMFAAFCLNYAGIPEEVMPLDSDTANWTDTLMSQDKFGYPSEYVPKEGDLVFADGETGLRVGVFISTDIDGNYLYVIEGDAEGTVSETEYPMDDVYGYGVIEDPVEEEFVEIEEDELYYSSYSSMDNDRYMVSLNPTVYDLTEQVETVSPDFTEAVNDDEDPSDKQIVKVGGTNTYESDSIEVSKTITGTDLENVFDITLEVKTTNDITETTKDPDMGIVIVMDISNTMDTKFRSSDGLIGSVTKYTAAVTAASQFLEQFSENNKGISEIGFVAFNTSAHKIFEMQSCTTATCDALITEMSEETKGIIKANGYGTSDTRYTNIEAGLKMAKDMLEDNTNENQYIIFLSDGLPTTYIKSGYDGYTPKTTNAAYNSAIDKNADGIFADRSIPLACGSGMNYSDKAAMKAKEQADLIHEAGIELFSIGIGIDYFNIGKTAENKTQDSYGNSSELIINQLKRARGLTDGYKTATIDHHLDNITYNAATSKFENTDFAIGDIYGEEDVLKKWLETEICTIPITGGVVDRYYYHTGNSNELADAFDSIYAALGKITESKTADLWVVEDPIPVTDTTDNVEFIGFWEKDDIDYEGHESLNGSWSDSAENTALYVESDNTINWDLKHSGYSTQQLSDSSTQYTYFLTYRVRLKNEVEGFAENESCITNGDAKLQYQVIVDTNGDRVVSNVKEIPFPIPEVTGYLGELKIIKKGSLEDNPLPGAQFTLTHDVSSCSICHGDGKMVNFDSLPDEQYPYVRTSDENGIVTFNNIPSGHKYILVETDVPSGYWKNNDTYSVEVAYDTVNVTITHPYIPEIVPEDSTEPVTNPEVIPGKEGNVLEITIINNTGYVLPSTGGIGTFLYTFGGLMIVGASGILFMYKTRRRQRG